MDERVAQTGDGVPGEEIVRDVFASDLLDGRVKQGHVARVVNHDLGEKNKPSTESEMGPGQSEHSRRRGEGQGVC